MSELLWAGRVAGRKGSHVRSSCMT